MTPHSPAGIRVADVHLAGGTRFTPSVGLAGTTLPLGAEIATLRGEGLHRAESPWMDLYRPLAQDGLRPFDLRLVPYFAWANRGRSAMSVWIPVVLRTP